MDVERMRRYRHRGDAEGYRRSYYRARFRGGMGRRMMPKAQRQRHRRLLRAFDRGVWPPPRLT